jgi:flagellin
MTRINTNVSSLVAQGRLNKVNSDLQTSLTRLSTGLRINSGKDDPAGLIASESLRSDITSLNKAISNTKRASQIVATADSALGQVGTLLNNVRGLVVEAANKGALSESEIAANQLQIDSSLEAINRIANTTSFQGRKLLDGSLDYLTQAGTNFSSVKDLKIDQANLGSSGTLAVNVDVTSAATQAEVAVAGVTNAVTGVATTGGGITLTRTVAAAGAERALNFTRTVGGSTATTGNIAAGGAGNFTLTTANNTAAYNGETVNVSTVASGNFSSITVDDTTGEINVVLEEGKTLADIATELSAHSEFTFASTATTNVTTFAPTTATFGTTGAAPSTQAASINVVADVGGASSFNIVFNTSGTPAVPTASLSGTTITVSVANSGDTSLEAIAEAIDGVTGFSATLDDTDSLGYFDANGTVPDTAAEATSVTAPVAASTQTATINLTATATGIAANGKTVTFNTSGSSSTPAVTVASNGDLTVSLNSSGSTNVADIISAITNQGTYTASAGSSNTLTSFTSADAQYTSATSNFGNNGVAAVTGGISHDAVFELVGKNGSEVFNVKAGTQIGELVSQINLVSDSTGVSASVDGGNPARLLLKSTEYGDDSFVDLRVVSENSAGTFTSAVGAGARDTGSDIVAKINGVEANGKGNSLSINTSSLALSLTVDAGSSSDFTFSITGGGATFQLGGDLVSNQQARVGIGSVSTARLGGVAGRLFQLASGESASLENNSALASRIVDDAIASVSSLRGRLGAFQATTLESNLVSLGDTVNNLTEAESSIRDADFAAESARLTRAQILVQSSTSVLGIANQNPQNVLSLLR